MHEVAQLDTDGQKKNSNGNGPNDGMANQVKREREVRVKDNRSK